MGRGTWRPPLWGRALAVLVPVVTLMYGVTLVPGLRGDHPVFVPWLEIGVGDGVIVASGLVCLLRARLLPQARAAWLMLGLAPLMYAAGDMLYYLAGATGRPMPYPSWADAAWLATYPLLNIGLVLLVRSQLRGVRASLWLDGLTGGLGAAAVLGAVALRPVLEATGGSLPVVLTNLAYPVCDLALLTVLMLVFNLHGWRPDRCWWLLGWLAAGLLVTDVVYLLQAASGTYTDGGLLDVGWPLAFAALGPAAWSRPREAGVVREGRATLVVPAALSMASTGVLFGGAVQALPFVVCVFGLLAVLIASLRLLVALVETRRLVAARREARTDELTGLPNRRHLLETIESRLLAGAPTTLMIIDLDRFKQINDSLGHGVGDMLLRVIGSRHTDRTPGFDATVARLGGDEFAILLDGQDETFALEVARRTREVIGQPIVLSGVTLSVDASIGIAYSPRHGTTWESLLSRADSAMYAAKRHRSGVEQYTEARDAQGIDHLELLAELRDALTRGALEVHYQPVHSFDQDRITSVEALVRWNHPARGLVSPAEFLPIAIEAGLSRQLTDEVLRMATAQAARWHSEGLDIPVAVNLTEADITDPELPGRIQSACERAGLPPSHLQLEVTESITAAAIDTALPMLSALRRRGHRILLDDFGTGYSSLSFLRTLPLDVVKLDRSFLADIDDPGTSAIIKATVYMAHALSLRIVAEGVETDSELTMLRELKCDSAQGFLIHRPALAETLGLALRHGSRRAAPTTTIVA